MIKRKFLSAKVSRDVYDSLFKDGLIWIHTNKIHTFLFIIGVDISYDTIDYRLYNKFLVLPITTQQVASNYINMFGAKKAADVVCNKNVPLMLLEILDKFNTPFNDRYFCLNKYFGIKEFKTYSSDEISKMVYFGEPTGYKHIDINTGLKFNDD